VVVLLEAPDRGLPDRYFVTIKTEWPNGELIGLHDGARFGATPLRLDLTSPSAPAAEGDTATVRILATIVEDVGAVGGETEVFAADTAMHIATFSPVGEPALPDTVHLQPR
jgi:hypothetical protein